MIRLWSIVFLISVGSLLATDEECVPLLLRSKLKKVSNEELAERNGLIYRTEIEEGAIKRKALNGEYRYYLKGRRVMDQKTLERIAALKIPNYDNVVISADPRTHVQAKGVDDAGRTQYRQHPKWIAATSRQKYRELRQFGEVLPFIRSYNRKLLAEPNLSLETVRAFALEILDRKGLRVGSEGYAEREENPTYALTTLERRHVRKVDGGWRLKFSAKKSIEQTYVIESTEPWIDAMFKLFRSKRLTFKKKNQGFLKFVDGKEVRDFRDSHVNSFMRENTNGLFTASTYRTWLGTVTAIEKLIELENSRLSNAEKQANAVESASHVLRNTAAVAKKSYVYPGVFAALKSGRFSKALSRARKTQGSGLSVAETVALVLLQ